MMISAIYKGSERLVIKYRSNMAPRVPAVPGAMGELPRKKNVTYSLIRKSLLIIDSFVL